MAEKVINIYVGATSMRTCLGNKSETLVAMQNGESGLRYCEEFSMYAGISKIKMIDGYTRFESMVIEQITDILEQSEFSLSNSDTQLIISTTKGNIELLANDCDNIAERAFLYTSAEIIAKHFHTCNKPIVISNACISGVSAFVVAREMLISRKVRNVIIVGCDTLCEFITSGFASFKSISPNPCKPYDANRDDLTLGEACGAVVLSVDENNAEAPRVCLAGGAISNDANHISGPSRTGDGLYYAIKNALIEAGVDSKDVGFVNTHGTATRYNDEMESKAVAWAELNDKPLNSFKGYIGHTLGAAGVVETIICVEQLRQGYIFGTKNFQSSDTPHHLMVSASQQSFDGDCCVKTASGFGGCNAAIVLDANVERGAYMSSARAIKETATYNLPNSDEAFPEFIRSAYKALGESNMKFYKMSDMCKALYVAVERLLVNSGLENIEQNRRAIVLSNRSASLDADIAHQQILNQHLPEGASPAAFVYTLANVAAGEICIRHKIQGDNTFFIENEDSGVAERYACSLIANNKADAVICGWCEYLKGNWNVNIKLLKNN